MDSKIITMRELITPEYARAIVRNSEDAGFRNRNLNQKIVREYAYKMRNGLWKPSGQTISISKEGYLLDGNHRLHALIQAGVSLEINVSRNVPKDAFDVYDIGKQRTLADMLYIARDVKYAPLITAGAKNIYKFLLFGELGLGSGIKVTRFILKDILPIIDRYPMELSEGAALYTSIRPKLLTQSNAVALYLIFGLINQDKRDQFFKGIKDGLGLTGKDPRYLLREKMLADRRSNKNIMPTTVEARYMVYAWNNFYQGRQMSRFTFVYNDQFPRICGFNREKFINSFDYPNEIKAQFA